MKLKLFVPTILWLILTQTTFAQAQTAPAVRFGVYDNPPLMEISPEGEAQGFVIDLIEAIAADQGWELTYIPCEWLFCLEMLEDGDVDLMGAIAYSEERSQRFDFSQETVLNNWGQVFTLHDSHIESILDLDGKRLAVLPGDIHTDAILKMLDSFDVHSIIIEATDYSTIFEWIETENVDAGVVNHFFAMQHGEKSSIYQSPIIFNPIEVRFAATKGQHTELLATIDGQLHAAKADSNSFYFQALETWFGAGPQPWTLPSWAMWVAAGGLSITALFLIITFVLRQQVRTRTQDLETSRERFELAVRGTNVGLWDWHIPSNETIYDERWAEIIGYTIAELTPTKLVTWERLVHPDDIDTANEVLEEHFAGEFEYYQCEYRMKHKSGHWVWVLDRGKVFEWDENGNPVRMAGTHLDVTQRKLAEQEIENSKQLFQSLLEQSIEGISVTDLDGNYIIVNNAFCVLMGYSEKKLLKMNVRDLVPENIDLELFPKVARGGQGTRTIALQRKDGSQFYAEVSGSSIRLQNERLVLGIVRDITSRIEQEQALRESEERLRGLTEATFEAIFLSEKGVCLEQNLAAEKMFGYTLEEAIGKIGTEWIIPEDRDLVLEHMLAGFESPYQVTALRKDGSTFPCEIRARMMPYQGRQVRVTALRDITEQVKAERSLHKRAEEMAALYQTTLDIIAPHSLSQLLETIVKRATTLLDGTGGGLYLSDAEKKQVRCTVSYNTHQDYTGTVLNFGEGAAGVVAVTEEPLVIDDYRTWGHRAQVYEEEQPFSAIISVPMRWQNQVIGVIHILHNTETRKFTSNDLNLLSSFANQAAIAVENARLYDELQSHAAVLETRVRDRTEELQVLVNAMAGRENRMAELKKVIQQLRQQLLDSGIRPSADDPLKTDFDPQP